jgi:D-arabinose 1-dehydrogenase-like Zn-dependent alcohol dehydrogenase
MGFRVAGIARGQEKAGFATQLGAHHYIDTQAQDPAAALLELGGAKVIVATATDAGAMQACIGGLGPRGVFMLIGAVPKLEIPPFQLISGNQAIQGWYSGTAIDSQDTLEFSVQAGIRSMNESFPMDRVNDAYDRMMSGKARFRVVLRM